MTQLSLDDPQRRLSELVEAAARVEETVITRLDQPRVKFAPVPLGMPAPRLESDRGSILCMADDFDDPLGDSRVYPE